MFSFSCTKEEINCQVNECDAKRKLIPERGNCKALIIKYFYNQSTNECDSFNWGGCDGVVPFETLQECENCK